MPRQLRIPGLLCVSLICGWGPKAAPAAFSPQAWQQAVDTKSSNWSREGLLKQFLAEYKLNGMERSKVLALLGHPATSDQRDPNWRYRLTLDTYCISAKGAESFRVDYDEQDKVTSHFFDAVPCKSCNLFIVPATGGTPVLKREALQQRFLEKHATENINHMKIKQMEAVIGKLHKIWTEESYTGGRMWVHSFYVWRLSADGHEVFYVWRYLAKTDWKPGNDSGVGSHGIISMSSDCSLPAARPASQPKRPKLRVFDKLKTP